MLIKTIQKPYTNMNLSAERLTVITALDQLIKERAETSSVLPGIADVSVLDDSDIITLHADTRVTNAVYNTGLATGAHVKTYQNTYFKYGVQKPYYARLASVIITPFGVTTAIGNEGASLTPTTARVGLPLPSTKFKKFIDMEMDMFSNTGMLNAKSIIMTNVTNQNVRIAYMLHVNSILGFYQGVLNKIDRMIGFYKSLGPEVGLSSLADALINDPVAQRYLDEMFINLKDFPIIDKEFHERINALVNFTYGNKKELQTPATFDFGLLIGTTANNFSAAGLYAAGADTTWDDIISVCSATIAGSSVDRKFSINTIPDLLFTTQLDADNKTAVLNLLNNMAAHTSNIMNIYYPYFQYIRYSVMKGWIAPADLSTVIDWELEGDGSCVVKAITPSYDYNLHTLADYMPIPQFIENTANNVWARVFCPISIASTGNSVSAFSSLTDWYRWISPNSLTAKSNPLSELASWALWFLSDDGDDAEGDALQANLVVGINPYDGLTICTAPVTSYITADDIISTITQSHFVSFLLEDINHQNSMPVITNIRTVEAHVAFSSAPYAAIGTQDPGIVVYLARLISSFTKSFGFCWNFNISTNTVGELAYALVCPKDDVYLVPISIDDFRRATSQYANQELLSVAKTTNTKTRS